MFLSSVKLYKYSTSTLPLFEKFSDKQLNSFLHPKNIPLGAAAAVLINAAKDANLIPSSGTKTTQTIGGLKTN
jgi:hypothetical protein